MLPRVLAVWAIFIVAVAAAEAGSAAAAPYKAGLRYIKNPLALEDIDDDNLPIWYPIEASNSAEAWNFTGDYPSATAARDASPASGSFPLIMFSPGVNVMPEAYNSILSYLASEGYVVVSSKLVFEYRNRTEWFDASTPLTGLASRFVVIYGRPRAFRAAIDAIWNATHNDGPDATWFNDNSNFLINWTAPVVAMGHSLGSNTALISGGMILRPCAPMNLTMGPDYLTLLDNQTQCEMLLSQGELDPASGPYDLRDARISAVIALDPGPSYWFPPGSTHKSWFTDESFSDNFTIPLLLSTMYQSSGNVEAAFDSFPFIAASSPKVLVIHADGSHNTYTNDCELRIKLGIPGPASPGCNASDAIQLSDYHASINRMNLGFLNWVVKGNRETSFLTTCDKALFEVDAKGFSGDKFLDCHTVPDAPVQPPTAGVVSQPPNDAVRLAQSSLVLFALGLFMLLW